MSAKRWAIYSKASGLFLGRHVMCDEKTIVSNTPEGCAAIEGRYDHESQRVDLDSGAVVDHVPPQPDADHEWDTDSRRWRKRADVALREAKDRATRDRIAELERAQLRPLRELALNPDDDQAKARLADVDAAIATQRASIVR